MTHLFSETLFLLKKYSIKPRRSLGQHFIVNENVVERMINYADVNCNDVVLEIGAGLGTLTSRLAKHAKKVYAVEVDPKLCEVLHDRFSTINNIEVICEDVLEMNFPSDLNKIISNLPYSIATPVTFKILDSSFQLAILTYQLDVAKRLAANPGTRDYGRLTVAVYYKVDVHFLEKVSKNAFYPRPKVDSAIVLLKPKQKPFNVIDEKYFLDTVRDLFSYRNKVLKKALTLLLSKRNLKKEISKEIIEVVEREKINLQKRVYTLSPAEFAKIANILYSKTVEEPHDPC